ncbi:Putative TRAF4-associated factor 1 [Heterocephalus glaber]|uniref:Putative TRAF4-associated factor 1 n=1 Tax=Heterocephalus glaber TaxID=10181 RepID=G5BLY8_HETGA|nr:Putative TRAF4-associated factor 1 [Heterocephalus glaber]
MTSVAKTVDSAQQPAAPSSGPPTDTKTRATSKSLIPVKSKDIDVSKNLHSDNDITKITKPKRENRQMKAAEPTVKRNIRKSVVLMRLTLLYPSVLGSNTLALQQEATTDRMDSVLLLETLQDELKLFNETAKKQMEELQTLKVKLKMKEEERAQFLEQRTLYKQQVTDFTKALEEMEQLLEM